MYVTQFNELKLIFLFYIEVISRCYIVNYYIWGHILQPHST